MGFLSNNWQRRHWGPIVDVLDRPLLRWSKDDAYSVRDLLNGGVLVLGRSGSAKTTGSGKTLLIAIAQYLNSGGLILAAKPEDVDQMRALFARAGRRHDLLVINADGALRLNFLDYVRSLGGDTREITKCITTIGETLRSSDSSGGEDSDFWEQERFRMMFCAVEIVKRATGKVSAPDLQRFIATAAYDPGQLLSESWQAQFHNQLMDAAYKATKTPIEAHDYQLAADYWFGEFPKMAAKTRSSIQTGVMGILHVFNTGIVRDLASTTTNVSPDDMFDRKWVLINMPASRWGDAGNFINAGWKYLTQKAVLHRKANAGDAINVIWADEAQQFVNSHDAHYLAQCRSHLGCMVFLTQSLHSLFAALKGENGKQQALALLTNFTTKIFHALGSSQDAEYASGLIGKSLQSFFGGSLAPQRDLFDAMLGTSNFTSNFSEHYESILQPNVFLNGLRCGGPANGFLCDAIVIKSGEPFRDGSNWKFVTFSQKG